VHSIISLNSEPLDTTVELSSPLLLLCQPPLQHPRRAVIAYLMSCLDLCISSEFYPVLVRQRQSPSARASQSILIPRPRSSQTSKSSALSSLTVHSRSALCSLFDSPIRYSHPIRMHILGRCVVSCFCVRFWKFPCVSVVVRGYPASLSSPHL
jgi:hypothetical protein